MFNPHWGRIASGKKSLVCVHAGSLWLCPNLCNPVDCGCQASLSWGLSSQEYWSVLATVAISFYSIIFPVALAGNTPEYLVLPEPLQSKQLHLALTGANANPLGQP